MPTDRYVLRTLAIRSAIRISRDKHPAFMLMPGAGHKVFHLLVSKLTVGLDFVTLASTKCTYIRSLRRAGSKEHTHPHTSTVSL